MHYPSTVCSVPVTDVRESCREGLRTGLSHLGATYVNGQYYYMDTIIYYVLMYIKLSYEWDALLSQFSLCTAAISDTGSLSRNRVSVAFW